MRIWHNLSNMKDKTYFLTKRGFQLSALFLAMGCWAILRGNLHAADQFRQFSTLALLFTAILTPYIELRSE